MKALGEFEVGEYVKPILPKFYVTGPYPFIPNCPGMFMYQLYEYVVSKKFPATPSASRSEVVLEDGYRGAYVLAWHTPMLARYEALPDAQHLANVADKLHPNNVDLLKEHLQTMDQKVHIATNRKRLNKSRPGDRMFTLRKENLAAAANLGKQARLCVTIITEVPDYDRGITEAELMEVFRTQAGRFNSKQESWRIFTFYLAEFRRIGLIEVDEGSDE